MAAEVEQEESMEVDVDSKEPLRCVCRYPCLSLYFVDVGSISCFIVKS